MTRPVVTMFGAAFLFLALLVACGNEDADWVEISGKEGDRAEAVARTEKARDALVTGLMAELMAAIQEGGPARGIGVCSERAPRIAATTGEEHGLRIGRSSFKLRNPRNEAPAWAGPAIAARSEKPRFFARGDEGFAALYPIFVAKPCLACHGPAEALAPEIRQALAEKYPADQATGFAEGDLRGWFWVEID